MKGRTKYFAAAFTCLCALLFTGLLSAEDKKLNIAVMEFQGRNVSAIDASVFADILRTEIVNQNTVNVIDKSNMDKVLSEAAFQQTGCTTSECAVQMGKILNVQKMIVGSLSKIEGSYCANANYVDVETGKIDKSETISCEKAKDFYSAANTLAKKLVGEGEDLRQRRADRKSWFGIGVGNPYLSLIFIINPKLSLEPRAAGGDGITLAGLRVNYAFSEEKIINYYTALEYYNVQFQGIDRIDNGVEKYESNTGSMAGIYFGGMYKISKRTGFCLDFGVSSINLGNGNNGVTVNGMEFVINTGIRFML